MSSDRAAVAREVLTVMRDAMKRDGSVFDAEDVRQYCDEHYPALAAARREVETVTKERDEARAEARTLALTNETFVEDLATSRAALEDVRRLFRHYETVPCLSSLLGEDTDDECECAGCMARKWMAKHGRALAAQEGE